MRIRENDSNDKNVLGGLRKMGRTSPLHPKRSIRRILGIILTIVLMSQYLPGIRVLGAQDGAMELVPLQNQVQAGGVEPAIGDGSGEQSSGEQPGGEQSSGEQPGGEQPGGEQFGGEQPGGEQPGGEQPGGGQLDGEQPDGGQPDGEQNTESGPAQGIPAAPQGVMSEFAIFAAGGADILFGENITCVPLDKSFELNVEITWKDSTAEFRPKAVDLPFEVYGGGVLLETGAVTLNANGSYTIAGVPVYIEAGTDGSGTAKYTTPEKFYTVRLKTDSIPGYEISRKIDEGEDEDPEGYIVVDVDLSINENNLEWSAKAVKPFICTLGALTSAKIDINWMDNNDKADKRPTEGAFGGLAELYYKVGNEYIPINSENYKTLGFLSDGVPTPEITETSVGVWTCEFKNLPEKIGGVTAEYYIKIAENENLEENYITAYSGDGYAADDGKITLTYTSVFTGTLIWQDNEYPDHSPRPDEAGVDLEVYLVGGSKLSKDDDYTLEWTKVNDGTWSYSITGLPMYDDEGKQNVYYVQIAQDTIEVADEFKDTVSDSYYNVSYDNKTVSAEKDKCYDKGVLSAVLKADATFTAAKVWVDGNDTAAITAREEAIAKGINLYLWRYPSNTEDDPIVAAVTENGTQLKYKLDNSYKAASKEIDFDKFNPQNPLPRFDEKGYEYIYFVTEVMAENSGYRTVYAEPESEATTDALYNGGALKNVRSEEIRVQTTKRWDVQGVDDYKSAQITLELQVYEDGEWVPAQYSEEDGDAVETVSGFTSTVKSKMITFHSVEKYDDDGKERQFRVVETLVDGVLVEDYEGEASPYEATYFYAGNSYKATSTQNDDGSWTVVNRLWGVVNYTINKVWSGSGDHSGITVKLKQDNTNHYATLVVNADGSYTITPEGLNKLYDASGEEQQAPITGNVDWNAGIWPFETIQLPAYDENGKAHVYSIVEDNLSGIWTRYTYSDKVWDEEAECYKAAATVTNYTTTGSSDHIRITKEWDDDNNLAQREAVTVQMVLVGENDTFRSITLDDLKAESDLRNVYTTDDALASKFTCILNSGNDWENYIDYDPADFNEPGKLAIIEAKVGTRNSDPTDNKWNKGTIPAEKIDDKIKIGYEYSISGTPGQKNFTITNKPVGTVSVTVDKAWKDSNNYYGYREAKFRVELWRDGIFSGDINDFYELNTDESKNAYGPFKFDELPMFDDDGMPHEYSVKEYIVDGDDNKIEILLTATAATTQTHYVSTMLETSEEVVDDNDVFAQNTTFSFTNTASGKKDAAEFYVVWRDEYNMNMQQRPDASYTLWRQLGDGPIELYTGPRQMTTESVEGANPYYQKITYSGMEEFDEHGTLYHYYVEQTLVNDDLYESAYYKDNDEIVPAIEVKDGGGIYHYKPDDGAVLSSEPEKIPEGGAIVNTIDDVVHIYGSKLWVNIDKELVENPDALPEALVYLWRSSNYHTENERPPFPIALNKLENALADTTLTANKDGYLFEKPAGGPQDFPKYDEYGALYKYDLSERIVFPEKIAGEGNTIDFPMEIMSAGVTTIALINTYKNVGTNSRKITVNKDWSKIGAYSPGTHPAAKFLLYRLEVAPDFGKVKPEQIAVTSYTSLPSKAELVGEAYTSTDDPTEPIVWENLPIYAPNGCVYVYFVCEDMSYVPGYDVSIDVSMDVDGESNSKGSYAIAGSGNLRIVVIGNNDVDVSKSSVDNTNEVKFTNTYKASTLTAINGTKTWVDNNDLNLVRPTITSDKCEDIILTLTRTAQLQPGQENEDKYIYNTPPETNEIKVEWVASGDNWTYTITPVTPATFPLYSENGNPYKYTVTETYKSGTVLEKNYKIATGTASVSVAAETIDGDTLTATPSLKNQLKGAINVYKIWSDGYNNYEIRESEVTVQLQRRVSDLNNWENAPGVAPIPLVPTGWSGSFADLPLTNPTGTAYSYRVVETKIGNTVVDVDNTANAENTSESINYDVTHSGPLTMNASGTANATIKNNLAQSTQLTVTKTWEDDTNRYSARPATVTLELQWKFVEDGAETWQTLYQVNGLTPVTKTIGASNATGNPNVWTVTFENLPKNKLKAGVHTSVQYRAVEMDGTLVLNTVGNVLDSYELTDQTDTFAEAKSSTSITNTLIEHTDITAVKRWNDNADHTTDSVVVELYSDNFDTTGGSGTTGKKIADSVGSLKPLNNANSFTYTWKNLPKYNPDQGLIVYYVKEVSVNGSNIVATTSGNNIKDNTQNNYYHVNYYVDDDLVTLGKAEVTADVLTTITAVNTPLTEAKVEKVWVDEGDKFDLRPTSVMFTLERKLATEDDDEWEPVTKNDVSATRGITGTDDITLTLTSSNANAIDSNVWEGSIKNLPAYELDKDTSVAYEYRFVETVPLNYSNTIVEPVTANNETTITNTLIMSEHTYTVNKVWDDNDNQDGLRPPSVTVELRYWNGADYVSYATPITATLSKTNSPTPWTWIIGELPKSGSYKIVEKAAPELNGYTPDISPATFDGDEDADITITVKNTHTPAVVTHKAIKEWAGEGDSATALLTRPAINMTLYRTYGTFPKEEVTVDQKGNTINPIVVGYGASAALTTPGVTDSDQSYSYTWVDLPKFIRVGTVSHEITYSVEETAHTDYSLAGYTQGTPDTVGDTTTITNTMKTTSWTVNKTWDDFHTSSFLTRPAKIEFTLFRQEEADGAKTTVDSVQIVSAATGTNPVWEIDGLPTHSKAGVEYIYSAEETRVSYATDVWVPVDIKGDGTDVSTNEYETTIVQSAGSTTVTNIWKYKGAEITIKGAKTWEDSGNLFGSRPDNLTLTVYRKNGASWVKYGDAPGNLNIVWIKNADNTWTYTISGLPKVGPDGNFLYAVKENVLAPYKQKLPPPATEYQEGIVDSTTRNVTEANFTNKLDPISNFPLVVTKTRDRGPDDMEFEFQVMFSADPITENNSGTLYKGAYKVLNAANGAEESTGVATDGTITITPLQKFVIAGIPEGYYYEVFELAHVDYELDEDDSTGMIGRISNTGDTIVNVDNDALTELKIQNETQNPIDPTNPSLENVGGKVVVIGGSDNAPSEWDYDSKDNALKVKWVPDDNWLCGSSFSILYTPFGSSDEFRINITNFSISEGDTISFDDMDFVNDADKALLKSIYPGASMTMTNGIVSLSLGSNLATMPRKTQIIVKFLPTLGIDNVTENNAGGTVQVEGGMESDDTDGLLDVDGHQYYATKVLGMAAAGFRLDTTQILLSNLGVLGGDVATLSIPANGGPFSASLMVPINGTPTRIDISGTAVLTKDSAGNVIGAVLTLDELPVPLQFDVLFEPIPIIPPSDNERDGFVGGIVSGLGNWASIIRNSIFPSSNGWISWSNASQSGRAPSPQTGDYTPIAGVAVAALLSGVGVLVLRKRPNGRKK